MSTPVFDAELMLRIVSDGALVGAESLGPLVIRGTPVRGMAVKVACPASVGGLLTVDVITGSQTVTKAFTVPAEGSDIIIPFSTTEEEVSVDLDTIVDLGIVQVGVVLKAHDEFSRDVDWS